MKRPAVFHWKTHRPGPRPAELNRPAAEKRPEVLTGVVLGRPASDIEERLYKALVKKFGGDNVVFQPSYLGPRNVSEVRPDFAVFGRPTALMIYADGEFTHHTGEEQQHDMLQDARLFDAMQGLIDMPVHIPERELKTAADAWRAVDQRW